MNGTKNVLSYSNRNLIQICLRVERLMLMACQPFWGYFAPRRKRTVFAVRSYLHLYCFLRVFFFGTWSYQIRILLNKSIWTIDGIPKGATAPRQKGLLSNGNEGVLNWNFIISWGLVSYQDNPFQRRYSQRIRSFSDMMSEICVKRLYCCTF